MTKIFIGIPTIREYKPFKDSIKLLIPEIAKNYKVDVLEVKNAPIASARNIIADVFLERDCDYLLFLDDDHEGHTIEMFNDLIAPQEYVCAMKCYMKQFPYMSNILEYSNVDTSIYGFTDDTGKYKSIDYYSGYRFCDVVGMGMTLIKRETFDKIEKPYFDGIKEDNYFCEKLGIAGIKPLGCFNHTLSHNGINEYNSEKLRSEEIERYHKEHPEVSEVTFIC